MSNKLELNWWECLMLMDHIMNRSAPISPFTFRLINFVREDDTVLVLRARIRPGVLAGDDLECYVMVDENGKPIPRIVSPPGGET